MSYKGMNNRPEAPPIRAVIMFEGRIPVHCPGPKMSWWFRRCLKYWAKHGVGTLYKAHKYGGGYDVKYSSCYYGQIKNICSVYAALNPHLIRQIPNDGKTTYEFVWREDAPYTEPVIEKVTQPKRSGPARLTDTQIDHLIWIRDYGGVWTRHSGIEQFRRKGLVVVVWSKDGAPARMKITNDGLQAIEASGRVRRQY